MQVAAPARQSSPPAHIAPVTTLRALGPLDEQELRVNLALGKDSAAIKQTKILVGQITAEPFGASDWRQRFRDWVMVLVHRKLLDALDATYLLFLSTLTQEEGSLRGKRADGRYAFHDEEWLAARIGIDSRTFRRRWQRWQSIGLVTTTGRPNRGRAERWLVPGGPDTSEINPVRSLGEDTVSINPVRTYKEVDSGGSTRVRVRGPRLRGQSPRGKANGNGRFQNSPPDCLRLGLDLLAVGVPVQIVKSSGTVIECRPDDPSSLMRMLGSNNPELAIAVLIRDKPSPGVLRGWQQFRVSARRQRETPSVVLPLPRVLAALEDHGIRPARKGVRWHSRCPGHERSKPDALEIVERSDGKVNVRCFKDCDWRLILDLIGLGPADLYPDSSNAALR